MGLYKFNNNTPFDANQVQEMFELNIHNNINAKIDQLIDRDVVRANDKVSPFVEAYIDATGRKNSVVVADTAAVFDTNKYKVFDNIFKFTGNTEATSVSIGGATTTTSVVCSALTNLMVRKVRFSTSNTSVWSVNIIQNSETIATRSGSHTGAQTQIIEFGVSEYSRYIQNGQAFTIQVTGSTNTIQVLTSQSFSGSLFSFSNQMRASEYEVFEVEEGGESTITHTIPSETFKDTVSSGVAAVKIVDWEDGASLQWKATTATEDTGWKDFNISGTTAYAKISDFTAFTAEPTKFVVKLIPKTTSPLPGVPSLSGVGIKLL